MNHVSGVVVPDYNPSIHEETEAEDQKFEATLGEMSVKIATLQA